jgi:hypothetical protein
MTTIHKTTRPALAALELPTSTAALIACRAMHRGAADARHGPAGSGARAQMSADLTRTVPGRSESLARLA